MEKTINFGERLRHLRKSRGLQQGELGEIFGLSPSAIGSYERGLREPSYKHLVAFAQHFGVSLDYLLGTTDETMTLEEYIQKDSVDLFDLMNKYELTINGYKLTSSDKLRLSDVAVGLFWSKFQSES